MTLTIENARLENILQSDIVQAINDAFNGNAVNVNKEKIISDIEWLIDQAKKFDQIKQLTQIQDIT